MSDTKIKQSNSPPGTGEYGTKRKGGPKSPDSSPKKPGDGPDEKSPPDFGQSVESG